MFAQSEMQPPPAKRARATNYTPVLAYGHEVNDTLFYPSSTAVDQFSVLDSNNTVSDIDVSRGVGHVTTSTLHTGPSSHTLLSNAHTASPDGVGTTYLQHYPAEITDASWAEFTTNGPYNQAPLSLGGGGGNTMWPSEDYWSPDINSYNFNPFLPQNPAAVSATVAPPASLAVPAPRLVPRNSSSDTATDGATLRAASSNTLSASPPGHLNDRQLEPGWMEPNHADSGVFDSSLTVGIGQDLENLAATSHPPGVQPLPNVSVHRQPNKKKRPYDPEQREKVKQVRKEGACLRCRFYKMPCDLDVQCANCRKVFQTATVFIQPCYRVNLKDMLPFRAGNSRTGSTRSILPKFAWSIDHSQSRRIEMTPIFHDKFEADRPTLRVTCRKFLPKPGLDVLAETYELSDGGSLVLEFPAWACFGAETTHMQKAISDYLDACRPFAERGIDASVTDEIVQLCLSEARRYSATRNTIVTDALKIQAAAFTSEIQPEIVGTETLGCPVVDNEKCGHHGRRLIPICLDYQMDVLYVQYMFRCLRPVVTGLNRLIFPKANQKANGKQKSWYEIFLAIFMLLYTLESVFGSQVAFVRKYAGSDGNVFAAASYVKRTMLEEWRASAKNLIYHFQCIVRGSVPFSQQRIQEVRDQADLDDPAVEFLEKLCQILQKRKEELRELKNIDLDNEGTTPLAWVAQILLDGD